MSKFVARQRADHAAYFARCGIAAGYAGAAWRLADKTNNLAPSIQEIAPAYFGPPRKIAWHRHANQGLSSQVCCLNFLMPLARRPDVLSRLVRSALGLPSIRVLPVETALDSEWYVGFEWTGDKDYLEEWPKHGKVTRGANATSADAFVRFEADGRSEALLIEWKYTESYGAALQDRRSADRLTGGNVTRKGRYADKIFAPAGPIRSDLNLTLEHFFWEPFYQLVRQQMLAWHTERDTGERTRVLHVSPRGNTALHKVTSKALREINGVAFTDAFEAFKAVLAPPDDRVNRFTSVYIEDLFGPTLQDYFDDPWARYLLDRYPFLSETSH